MKIRPARESDVRRMYQIQFELEHAAQWPLVFYEDIFSLTAPPRSAMVAESPTGEIEGFAVGRLVAGELDVENVAVVNPFQRRGVGRELMNALLARAEKEGAETARLEVRESNLAARALYRACGFEESGRRSRYYDCPREDAILYSLRLGPSVREKR